jgi:hypothetical protein
VEVLEVAWNKAATGATELQGSGNGGARRGHALLERAASPSRVALPAARGKCRGRWGVAGEDVLRDETVREVRVERAVLVRGWVHVRARARGAAPAVVPAHGRKAEQAGPGATAYGVRRAVSSVLFGREGLTAKR